MHILIRLLVRLFSLLLRFLPYVLVFVVIWVLAVLFWRMNDSTPSLGGAALVLLGLPIGLIIGYFALKKGFDIAKTRSAAAQAADDEAPAADEPDVDANDPERAFSMQVLAGAVRLPNGADAAALVAAVKEGKAPELHPTLMDHRGLPTYAATADAADPDAVETSWDVLEPAQVEALEPVHRRALALAAQVLDDLVVAAEEAVKPSEEAEPGAAEALETVLLLPESWPEATRAAGRDWLQQHADQGAEDGVRLQIKALPMADSGQVLATIDELRLTLNRRQLPAPQLLLACDSRVDEELVHRWGTIGRLKASGNDEGQVPGEGAAGLLVAWPEPEEEGAQPDATEEAAEAEAAPPIPHLYRVARDAHAQPVGDGRRVKDGLLGGLIVEALADAGFEADAVAGLVSDADTRPSRSVELVQSADANLPELDSAVDGIGLGTVAGDCGCAAELAAVAIAAFQVQELQAPVVLASVADAQARAAAVVAVPPAEADQAAAEDQASAA